MEFTAQLILCKAAKNKGSDCYESGSTGKIYLPQSMTRNFRTNTPAPTINIIVRPVHDK